MINPRFKRADLLEVVIDTAGDDEMRRFVDNLDLERRYSRHLDIVKELEYAQYLDQYYQSNFTVISDTISNALKREQIDEEILKRHIRGFYGKKEDINRRPLTKFSQDIFDQLSLKNQNG